MTRAAEFLILTPSDCTKVLGRNHVGRLAFRIGESVDIQPVGYVANSSWLFMRSAHGTKLEALAHNPFVAFEVDEIDGPFDWRSVVAHGTIYLLPRDGAPIEQREFQRALKALRRVVPDALTPSDPVPDRDTVYGLHIDRLTGRRARSRSIKPTRRVRTARRPSSKGRTRPNGT